MRTLALTIAYDGTDWSGFQRQREFPSVQGELETALAKVLYHPVEIAAAGRTDAGVHALAQVISCTTSNPIPIDRIPWVTNRFLPPSIRVRRAIECPPRFHARFAARYRRYWYVIQTAGGHDPFRGRYRWQLAQTLNIRNMQAAMTPILGTHDFVSFCHEGNPTGTTVRTVQRADVRRWQGNVIIDVQADAFLHQMARLLVANLVKIGTGECPVTWLETVLAANNRHLAGMAAPPCGLYLMRIGYPPMERLHSQQGIWWSINDEKLSG